MRKRSCFGAFDFSKLANDTYSGTADFGKFYAKIVSIFSFVIAVIIILLGIYFLRQPATYPVKVQFTIKTVTPTAVTTYTTVNGVQTPYTQTFYNLTGTVASCGTNVIILNNYSSYVIAGQTINAYMQENCGDNIASQYSGTSTWLGWIFIIIGILIIIYNIVRILFVKKFKGVAALQGIAGGKNILEHLF